MGWGWFSKKEKKEEKKQDGVIRIRLSGDESVDIQNSFKKMGITSIEEQEKILLNYTWHYLDDLDANMECTMQLVQTAALEAAKRFSDSRDIMEQLTGIKYIRKNESEDSADSAPDLKKVDISEIRALSLSVCKNAGFKPASSLPTIKPLKLRPAGEIAGRLHAIKALVLWLLVSTEDLPDDEILDFIDRNDLSDFLSEDELEIIESSRDDEESRNAIGWKFENAWPLAWYFGYTEPEITGQMMSGEQMQELLKNHTCALSENVADWAAKQNPVSEEAVMIKEDLFYCLHNAVRSAQLGKDTVPNGFDPMGNGGVIHERRHSLTWMLSKGVGWEDADLST